MGTCNCCRSLLFFVVHASLAIYLGIYERDGLSSYCVVSVSQNRIYLHKQQSSIIVKIIESVSKITIDIVQTNINKR